MSDLEPNKPGCTEPRDYGAVALGAPLARGR
jgi:hypothetical protein